MVLVTCPSPNCHWSEEQNVVVGRMVSCDLPLEPGGRSVTPSHVAWRQEMGCFLKLPGAQTMGAGR